MPPEAPNLGRLASRLREGGWRWIWRRLKFEAATPTTRLGRHLHRACRKGITLAREPRRRPAAMHADAVLAFYDLKVSPITFDFLWFLAGADLMRRRIGAKSVHVVIVPGDHEGVREEREDYEDVITPAARRLRLFNLTIPAVALLPSAAGLTLAGSRAEARALREAATNVYPEGYEPALPTFMHPSECLDAARNEAADIAVLRAPPGALDAVDQWLDPRQRGRRLITITLRHYRYMPVRNSRLAEWAAFARSLDRTRFFVVIVPDTNQTLDAPPAALDGIETFGEAAWNVPLRMALYQRAFLNLGVNNGPMCLCWLNAETRYVTFCMRNESVPQTTLAYMRSLGFEANRSLPFAMPHQKWLWDEPDTAEIIGREFEEMIAGMGVDDRPRETAFGDRFPSF